MEASRFDAAMARYEISATRIWTSLGWLNFGQAVIFGIGMAVMMIMSGREVIAGTQTLGDFRLHQCNADAIVHPAQLYRLHLSRSASGV